MGKVYELTETGKANLKKLWLITTLGYMISCKAVFTYNLLRRGGGQTDVFIFIAIAVIASSAFYYGRKKYFNKVNDTRLIVTEDSLTLKNNGEADIMIRFDDIRQVKCQKHHYLLVNKNQAKKSLLLNKNFEQFDEIENTLLAKAPVDCKFITTG